MEVQTRNRNRNSTQSKSLRFVCALLVAVTVTQVGCITLDIKNARRIAAITKWTDESPLEVRKSPRNPLEDELNLLGWSGPKPSDRTKLVFRRYGLDRTYESNPTAAYEKLAEYSRKEPSMELTYAVAEVAYILAKKAEAGKKKDKALIYYGESIVSSYEFLFGQCFDDVRNAYDPQFRGICDLYNVALEGMLRSLGDDMKPGYRGQLPMLHGVIDYSIVSRARWNEQDISDFEFSNDYEVNGLNTRYQTYGLGVPLIAIRRQHEHERPEESYYPDGLALPMTAFFRVLPSRSLSDSGNNLQLVCSIELIEPLLTTDIEVAGRRAPLESDITIPLAYYLNDPLVGTNTVATFALLDANFGNNFEGLYMLEPYDPNKIPVLMVHGLWSSPSTWMEMFNDLRSQKQIRDNYQFWFYMYPSGQPFWVSAQQLREDLARARDVLDPDRSSQALDQMVLVGHSMGGLVSRLQTLDSGDDFWRIVSDKPIDQLQADPNEKQQIQQVLYFQPNPSIKRVVTIGTPHRGSNFANSTTTWLSRKVIKLPTMLTSGAGKLVKSNPGFFTNSELLSINTSVDSLSPKSPFFEPMMNAKRPPWVQYHNIIGRAENNSVLGIFGEAFSGDGDGVVPISSAHAPDAKSEIIIPSDHLKVHQNPLATLEVRRILLEHLQTINPGVPYDPYVQPTQFQNRVLDTVPYAPVQR